MEVEGATTTTVPEDGRSSLPAEDSEVPLADRTGSEVPETLSGDVVTSAYVRDVVEATGVAPILSEKEEEDLLRQRQRKYLIIASAVCFVVALAISIPLVTVVGRNNPPEIVSITDAPTVSPSTAPSSAPTKEQMSEVFNLTVEFLREQEVNNNVLETQEWWNDKSSAPYQAARWVSSQVLFPDGEEEKNLNQKLVQRYALAAFYYSTTTGDQFWDTCNPGSACISEPWLSAADECQWGYVTCDDETGIVKELTFRK